MIKRLLTKIIWCLIMVIVLSSCNSIYSSSSLGDVTKIKISKYNNYYEQNPTSESLINNTKEIKKILSPLKFIFDNGVVKAGFHNFDSSKIQVELISEYKSVVIFIVENKIEINGILYDNNFGLFQGKFIKQVSIY